MKLTQFASARKPVWAVGLATAMYALATPLGAQNLVVNGGFETGNFSGWTQAGNFAPWNTFVGNSSAACPGNPVHTGIYGACLGPPFAPGYLIQQSVPTTAGGIYNINFWVQHQDPAVFPAAYFNAFWEGIPIYSSFGGYFNYTDQSATVVAANNGSVLQFQFQENPSYWNLDDVWVSSVPEPGSMALLSTGLVGLYGAIRRRREKQD